MRSNILIIAILSLVNVALLATNTDRISIHAMGGSELACLPEDRFDETLFEEGIKRQTERNGPIEHRYVLARHNSGYNMLCLSQVIFSPSPSSPPSSNMIHLVAGDPDEAPSAVLRSTPTSEEDVLQPGSIFFRSKDGVCIYSNSLPAALEYLVAPGLKGDWFLYAALVEDLSISSWDLYFHSEYEPFTLIKKYYFNIYLPSKTHTQVASSVQAILGRDVDLEIDTTLAEAQRILDVVLLPELHRAMLAQYPPSPLEAVVARAVEFMRDRLPAPTAAFPQAEEADTEA